MSVQKIYKQGKINTTTFALQKAVALNILAEEVGGAHVILDACRFNVEVFRSEMGNNSFLVISLVEFLQTSMMLTMMHWQLSKDKHPKCVPLMHDELFKVEATPT